MGRSGEVKGNSGHFADHFSGVAPRYVEFRPRYPRELFEWLASIAPARDRAWDCATGNGQAALGLEEFFRDVIATDASAGQIANAVRHSQIHYAIARAEASGMAGNSFDLVTVAQAAHWLDRTGFYAEARRTLRPGGILAIWCYGQMRFGHPEIDALLRDYYTNIVGPFWPPGRHYIEDEFRTIDFPFPELRAPRFQMRAEFTLERLAGYLRTWSATQRYLAVHPIDPVSALEDELARHWPAEGRLAVTEWPIGLRVARL